MSDIVGKIVYAHDPLSLGPAMVSVVVGVGEMTLSVVPVCYDIGLRVVELPIAGPGAFEIVGYQEAVGEVAEMLDSLADIVEDLDSYSLPYFKRRQLTDVGLQLVDAILKSIARQDVTNADFDVELQDALYESIGNFYQVAGVNETPSGEGVDIVVVSNDPDIARLVAQFLSGLGG